uniref:AMP-dependent synthetase/ligase domain-containing protein n=2 Tax=Meloidogyne TaxID=189290 RepID=A0A915P090_9BILA
MCWENNNEQQPEAFNDDFSASSKILSIKNKKFITKIVAILPKLDKKFQHLKRVWNNQILICINEEEGEDEEKSLLTTIKQLLEEEEIKISQQFVPRNAPLTQIQCELAKKYWPISFHKNSILEAKLNEQYFSTKEIEIYSNLFFKVELTKGLIFLIFNIKIFTGVLFYDPKNNKIVCSSTTNPKHPLKHAVIQCIDILAKIQEQEKISKDGQYLATGFDAILFKEPCTMCAMALVHCRVKRIFFGEENKKNGALITKWRLQESKSLNHHFEKMTCNKNKNSNYYLDEIPSTFQCTELALDSSTSSQNELISKTFTFTNLMKIAHKILNLFKEDKNQVIGAVMEKSALLVCVLIGIIKSKNSFIILEPSSPEFTLSQIKRFKIAKIIYHSTNLLEEISIKSFPNSIQIEENLFFYDTGQEEENNNFEHEQIAYAIQTSGSTGEPKIVHVPYSCIMPNIDDFIQRFSLTQNSSILFSTCLGFDPSMVELFLSIKLGAQLIIPPREIIGGISHSILKKFEKINFVQTTPALLQCLSTNCLNFIFGPNSSIEFLLIGGENFPLNLIRRYINCSTKTRIFNVYGLTEVSCWASCFEFNCENIGQFSNDSIPIGNPLLETKFGRNEEKILQIYGRKCFINFLRNNEEEPTTTGDIAFKKIINNENLICVKSRYKPQSQLPSLELETFILNNCLRDTFVKLVFVGACKFLFLKVDGNYGIDTKDLLKQIPKRLWPTRIFCIAESNIRSDFLTLNGKIDETKLIEYIKLNYYNKFTSLLNFLNKNYNIPLTPTLSDLSSSLRNFGIGSLEAVEICFYLENFSSSSSKNIFETFGDKMQFILDESTTLGNFLEIFENSETNGNQINIVEDIGKEEKCIEFELINSTLKSRECWNVDLGKCIDGTPVCSDGVIYAASHSGILKGISLTSGSTIFNYLAENERFEAGCVVNQNYLAIGGFSGNLLVFENNLISNQQPFLTISCSSEIRMTPIFDEKFNLIWGDYSGIIYNLNIQNGELKQIFNCTKHSFGSLRTSPLIVNNLIIFATLNGTLFAIDK